MIALLEGMVETTEKGLIGFFASNIIISIFAASFLQFLWGLINTLQIIMLTTLFDLQIPINAKMVMTMLMQLCAMDFLHTETIFNTLFKFRETPAFRTIEYANGEEKSSFADAGYESANFVLLTGPMILLIVAYLVYLLLKKLLRLISKCICKKENCFTRSLSK